MAIHDNDQSMIFKLISLLDYSLPWDKIELDLDYNMEDYHFNTQTGYDLANQLAKSTWAILNGKIDSNRNVIIE